MITIAGCGSTSNDYGSSQVPIYVNFTTYSSFPAGPWTDLASGYTSLDWSTSTSNGVTFEPQGSDPTDALLLYNNYSDTGVDTSVYATIMISIAPNGQFGLYLWASDDLTSSYYQLIFDIEANSVTINKIIPGGSSTQIGSASAWSLSDANFHTYQFSISGSGTTMLTLTAYVDDVSKLSVTDSSGISTGSGYTGFFFTSVTNASISTYQITQP